MAARKPDGTRVRDGVSTWISKTCRSKVDTLSKEHHLGKTETMEWLIDLGIEMLQLKAACGEQLTREAAARGKTEAELLLQVADIGLECLPVYESIVRDRPNRVRDFMLNKLVA